MCGLISIIMYAAKEKFIEMTQVVVKPIAIDTFKTLYQIPTFGTQRLKLSPCGLSGVLTTIALTTLPRVMVTQGPPSRGLHKQCAILHLYIFAEQMAEITTATIRLLNSLHQRTPLHKEAACGSVDTVRDLVNRGADVNVQDKMGVRE